jgi:hypothetical protein
MGSRDKEWDDMRRLTMAAALAMILVFAMAQPASADWFQQSTPVPATSTAELAGVSCPSATACVAVGAFSGTTDSGPLVEVKDGSTWTIQIAPSPSGAPSSQLSAVSCSSAASCTAVGSFVNGTNVTVPLVERWNGTSWTIEIFPTPSGATSSQLEGVSCITSAACTAVGSSVNRSGDELRLAAAWNGSTWKRQATPGLAGTTQQDLRSVACTTSDDCTAVGSYRTRAGATVSLAEVSSRGGWSVQPTVNPSAATFSPLDSVSCPSTRACTAVGSGFAERRAGGTWTLETVPRPQGSTSGRASLTGVSCTSATACTAVGYYDLDGVQSPVAATVDGTHWRLQETPLDTSYDSSALAAVSCRTAAVSCIAVGTYHDPTDGNRTWAEAFALRWQPEIVSDPAGSIASALGSTSCSSPTACMAVGNAENAEHTFTAFSDRWDGSGWTTETTPRAATSYLAGVSCTSATACTAVGDATSGARTVSLAERWDGTEWKVQRTPNPAGSTGTDLSAVSCSSAKACTAVGTNTRTSGRRVTLAETWNGMTWSIHRTPDAGTSDNDLNAVSCTSANACTAVGDANTGTSEALTEVWDGTRWTILGAPTPNGGTDSYLSGVSCSAATMCTAVGDYFNGRHTVPLSEHRDGSRWTSQVAAVPHGATGSGFSAISCVSATNCVAVGFDQAGATPLGLAEGLNHGRWSVQSVTVPAGSERTYLQSVSCPSALTCTATGAVNDSTGTEDVLVELYS